MFLSRYTGVCSVFWVAVWVCLSVGKCVSTYRRRRRRVESEVVNATGRPLVHICIECAGARSRGKTWARTYGRPQHRGARVWACAAASPPGHGALTDFFRLLPFVFASLPHPPSPRRTQSFCLARFLRRRWDNANETRIALLCQKYFVSIAYREQTESIWFESWVFCSFFCWRKYLYWSTATRQQQHSPIRK